MTIGFAPDALQVRTIPRGGETPSTKPDPADIQIKLAGVDAAAPLAEGMVISIATPSGANRLTGSVGGVFTARSWNGNNTPGGTPVISQTVQADLAVGGLSMHG